MSLSLTAPARSAYRALWRASALTFAGDVPVLSAFREKMRADAANWRTLEGPALDEQVQLARDVAGYLATNLAQIRRVDETSDVWRLRIHEQHEIGDNTTIKNPPPMKIPPKGKRRAGQSSQAMLSGLELDSQHGNDVSLLPKDELNHHLQSEGDRVEDLRYLGPQFDLKEEILQTHTQQEQETASTTTSSDKKSLNYSQLKKVARKRVLPELNEDDLEECFVRGHGPGGQSINKTNNNVQIIHRPTGIRVVCQQTRSLALNRMYARRILIEKLDKIANPGLSKGEVQRAKVLERERQKRKKAKKERDEDDRARRKALRKEEKRAAQVKNEESDD